MFGASSELTSVMEFGFNHHHHQHHHLGYCTHGDGAKTDAAGRLQILLRSGFEIVYNKKRARDVDARVLVEHLKVAHTSTVVAERVTDATHGKGRTHRVTLTSLTHTTSMPAVFFPPRPAASSEKCLLL